MSEIYIDNWACHFMTKFASEIMHGFKIFHLRYIFFAIFAFPFNPL